MPKRTGPRECRGGVARRRSRLPSSSFLNETMCRRRKSAGRGIRSSLQRPQESFGTEVIEPDVLRPHRVCQRGGFCAG